MTQEPDALRFLNQIESKLDSMPKTQKHLTESQRATLVEIFNECGTKEFLLCVAGLVTHSEPDYSKALDAGDLIRKAARTVTTN